ncbi:hypothetical protein BX666DRAFT_2000121 [Dichotomocladium elegans]|nr:hypothetical protein BX666DRAFT_2000121 [Dichotomocladium elegans]
MDFLSQATNVSNWTLSIILGTTAALQSGSQNGIVGELPICDLIHALTLKPIPNGQSPDNVFIGFKSHWARMMLSTLQSRKLEFCYVFLEEDGPRHPECHCHMAVDPMWQKRQEYATHKMQEAKNAENNNSEKYNTKQQSKYIPLNFGHKPPPISDDPSIRPNMFYSLMDDFMGTDGIEYKVVHRPGCIPGRIIDKRAVEFLSDLLTKRLTGLTNKQALEHCVAIIQTMGTAVRNCEVANEWDTRIIDRVENLMMYPNMPPENDVFWNEVMDRIHSRIPDMLRRLSVTKFVVDGDVFGVEDVTRAFIIYFGIQRAIAMSQFIHDEKALVLLGYNISVGHELIRDLTEIPSTSSSGYSGRLVLESSTNIRVVDKEIEPSHIFQIAILLDAVLSICTMILSGLGPVLSMYTSRRMTAPYRESFMQMGTTMRWSVSKVSMLHSGTARDDWMVCLHPAKNVRFSIFGFFSLSFIATFGSIIAWPFFNATTPSVNELGRMLVILSSVVGIPWVILAQQVQINTTRYFSWQRIVSMDTVHSFINLVFVIALTATVAKEIVTPWVFLYLFEYLFLLQWLYGELFDNWVYESTSLFLLGVLGAFRLSNLTE